MNLERLRNDIVPGTEGGYTRLQPDGPVLSIFDVLGLRDGMTPRADLKLRIHRANGTIDEVPVVSRIDTAVESNYFRLRHGGISPQVYRELIK